MRDGQTIDKIWFSLFHSFNIKTRCTAAHLEMKVDFTSLSSHLPEM